MKLDDEDIAAMASENVLAAMLKAKPADLSKKYFDAWQRMKPLTLPLLQKYWHLVECLEYDKKQSKWIVRDLQAFEVDPMPVLSFTKEELQDIKKLKKK